jgi:hypothetical protein
MNAVQTALSELKFRVPREVLEIAFPSLSGQQQHSLDSRIMAAVVRPRVLLTCNIIGGREMMINVMGLYPRQIDRFTTLYEIPHALTAGGSIVSVLDAIYYGGASSMSTASPRTDEVASALQRLDSSHTDIPIVANVLTELVGENTVIINDVQMVRQISFIRCMVTNDENLANISPRSYLAISKMVELAVKSYIYNKLVVDLDEAYLKYGSSLETIKRVVEQYEGAEDEYQLYMLEKGQKILFMNDMKTHDMFIRQQVTWSL